MNETAAAFVFLRPVWLYALLALPLLVWALRHRRRASSAWQRAVDPHLLPHLLQAFGGRESHGAGVLFVLGYTLAVTALAGPSWRQAATPLFQVQAPLVIALDLSSAMRAADLPPSRLTQARAKLAALLDARRGGQVGLLAFAEDAYTVAPITRDAKTVKALLDSLSPDIMPGDGQRGERAISQAVELMRGAKFERGEVLLVTDHADRAARSAAANARASGFRVSVLGVGTGAGAPVSGPSGFATGPDGKVQLARLDAASLRQLASAGGGGFAVLTQDMADLESLGVLDPQGRAEAPEDAARAVVDTGAAREGGVRRVDQGYWLLLALLPVVLLGFRRSWLVMLPLAVSLGVLAPVPFAHAQTAAAPAADKQVEEGSRSQSDLPAVGKDEEFSWESLWKRPDQRAREALEKGETEQARALARDPSLAASAAYRGQDFGAAAETWDALDEADAKYNRGNALAKSGKLEDALAAYDEALEREPGMPDAVANRKIVEDALKQQQQQQQQQGDKQQQGDEGKDQQQGDQQQQDQQQGDQKSGEQKDGQQPQDGENKDGKQKEGEQDKGEPKDGEEQGKDPQQGEDEGKDPNESDSAKSPQGDEPSDEEKANDKPGEGDKESQPEPKDPKLDPEAQAAQQRADEEAKREMQQALEAAQQEGEGKEAEKEGAAKAPLTAEQRAEEEQRQALERWLRRVPDDPGALLRRKFALEHQRRQSEGNP